MLFAFKDFKRPAVFGLIAGLVMGIFSLTMPNYYRSEARILPVDARGGGSGLGGLATAAAAFGLSMPADGGDSNFTDILNSRSLREKLLETEFSFKFKRHRFGREDTFKGKLLDFLHVQNIDQGVEGLRGMIQIAADPKSKLLTLEAETISPELSRAVVARMLGLLEQFVQQKGRTRGGAKAVFASARLEEARQEMSQAEGDFRKFLEGNRNYQASTDPYIRLTGIRLEAELRLRQQVVTTLALSREQSMMEEKNDIPILNVLDAGNLPYDKSRPSRARTVLLAALVAGIGTLLWGKRADLRQFLVMAEGE